MISAVLDTNVLASGTVTATTPPGQILDAWRAGQFELITSEHIIEELGQTFQKPYFKNHLNNSDIASFIDLLQNEAIVTPITVRIKGVATHPEDDLTIAAALSAKADYLVTGDQPLLHKVGNSYRGITILTPSDFLKTLQQAQVESSGD